MQEFVIISILNLICVTKASHKGVKLGRSRKRRKDGTSRNDDARNDAGDARDVSWHDATNAKTFTSMHRLLQPI